MLFYYVVAVIIYSLIDKYKQKLYFNPSSYMSPTKNKIIMPSHNHYAIINYVIINYQIINNPTNNLKLNKSCLLISHGNAGNISNRDYLLEILNSYDGDIYCYEYPGFGKCEGSVSIASCITEHIYWLERLSQKYPKIDLWGESIGGGIIVETLCKLDEKKNESIIKKINRIYLQSTFSSIYNVIKTLNPNLAMGYYILGFDDLEVAKSLSHSEYKSKFKNNEIIIMHSITDEIIPFSEAEILYNTCAQNKLNVKIIEIKGDHNNISLGTTKLFQ